MSEIEDAAALANARDAAGAVHALTHAAGWIHLKKVLEGRLVFLFAQLLDPSRQRERLASDDYIRGQIKALTLILKTPVDLYERYSKIVADAEAEYAAQRELAGEDWRAELAAQYGMRAAGFPDPGPTDDQLVHGGTT